MSATLLSECQALLISLGADNSIISVLVNKNAPTIKVNRWHTYVLWCKPIYIQRIRNGHWPIGGYRAHVPSRRAVRMLQHIVMQIRAHLRETTGFK